MITIVTFNPSIDNLYKVESIELGKVQRVLSSNRTAGGKGINVAKVCKILNEDPCVLGFVGGFNGEFIKAELKKLKIEENFTKIDKETRNCLNIIDKEKISTEFLEKGPEIKNIEYNKFFEDLEIALKNTKILIATGSCCLNMPEDCYEKIGNMCRGNDIKFILDSSGEPLKKALKSKPFLIKPNIDEIEQILGEKMNSELDIILAGKTLKCSGAENVCISLGKDGMIFINDSGVYRVRIPKVNAENPVGSGDSTVAGFAVGVLRNYGIYELLSFSNACGISNALNLETGFVKKEEVEKYKNLVEVIKVD